MGKHTSQNQRYLKSPMNYIGGKYRLLDQILPLFPNKIDNFIDLFSGGCNVSINVNANKIFCNDNLFYVIELYEYLQKTPLDVTINLIKQGIELYKLSKTNEEGYKELRCKYNDCKEPILFFLLICYSFNHQIRYNNSHRFTTPFGKERSQYNKNIEYNLTKFVEKLQNGNFSFSKKDFRDFDLSLLTDKDFIYCDPPYLITTGAYNDGKRGFNGWNSVDELQLLELLDDINNKGIKFALSNVLYHKGKKNDILIDWLNNRDYHVHHLSMNYNNSSYHSISTNDQKSDEVLITNYKAK